IVFRVDLAPGDFEIAGSKTLAVAKTDAPRLRVEVWNLSDAPATGTVAVSGVRLAGLPDGEIAISPFGKESFDCVLEAPEAAGEGAAASSSAVCTVSGRFDGRDASPLSMPVLFERALFAACEETPLPWRDPEAWTRNDSAAAYRASWDEKEQAVRFDVEWTDPAVDRWVYPVLELPPELRGLEGAVRAVFEVKSAQDKVENDFKNDGANFMLVRTGGADSPNDYLSFAPPGGEWERRYVELSTAGDMSDVRAVRLGCNPLGMRLSFWIRNVSILRLPLQPPVRGSESPPSRTVSR
ncbi:MAG: hypothetical protein IJ678_03370, partial [Kiritimatiellae bacterium]|nr:hypothetical protein [Kiritimatiellia bacterium]